MAKAKNYINNQDLLIEIAKSKNSYSYFVDPQYEHYHAIVSDLANINAELIKKIGEDIPVKSLVFRLMTFDHIPSSNSVSTPKKEAHYHVPLNFPPFKHYIIQSYKTSNRWGITGFTFKEVGRSHWEGGLRNGHFKLDGGKLTNKLGNMFLKLVDRYGKRGNWNGYSYLEEMKGEAICQLSKVGLQFDESRSEHPNPFAFYTTIVTNAYRKILSEEKRVQSTRDNLRMTYGLAPSMTRQLEDQIAQQQQQGQYGNIS